MYCCKCGHQVNEAATYCDKCGQALNGPVNQAAYVSLADNSVLLNKLISKLKTEVYIWIGVAVVQVLVGGIIAVNSIVDGEGDLFSALFLLLVAVINFANSYATKVFSKRIAQEPVGIGAKYTPITKYIVNLIYNLLFGGVVGIIGSIYGLMIRNFVMENKQVFLLLENQHSSMSEMGAYNERK